MPRRLLLLFLVLLAGGPLCLEAAALSEALGKALADFRADGPRGWSYVQTTRSASGSLVERFDARQPEFNRWSLIEKDGRAPTADETRTYLEGKTRRTAGLQAPRIQDQLDLATAEPLPPAGGLERWRFRLKPGGPDDRAAGSMAAIVSFHVPTATVAGMEIASLAPFSPVLGVRIAETRTVMEYSLPDKGTPSFLKRITLRVRGRAFWFKSIDDDMVITYGEHTPALRPQP